jgi:hypothetical protein
MKNEHKILVETFEGQIPPGNPRNKREDITDDLS